MKGPIEDAWTSPASPTILLFDPETKKDLETVAYLTVKCDCFPGGYKWALAKLFPTPYRERFYAENQGEGIDPVELAEFLHFEVMKPWER
jgi:hypothetical protein